MGETKHEKALEERGDYWHKLYSEKKRELLLWETLGIIVIFLAGFYLIILCFSLINPSPTFTITQTTCVTQLSNIEDYRHCLYGCRAKFGGDYNRSRYEDCNWNCTIEKKTYCETTDVENITYNEEWCKSVTCAISIHPDGTKTYASISKSEITEKGLDENCECIGGKICTTYNVNCKNECISWKCGENYEVTRK